MHNWNDDRIFQRACVGLARMGHDVHLIALGGAAEYSTFCSIGVTIYLMPKISGLKRRVFGSRNVIKKAIELNANVYQFHDPDILPHIQLLRKACPQAALIYDIHENYAGRFVNWGLPTFLGTWFRTYEKRIINRLDGITVVSESMKELFESVVVPIEITRNSTDLERLNGFKLPSGENSKIPLVVTSGTHSHDRNCLQTIKAIKYVRKIDEVIPIFQFVGRYINGIENEMNMQADQDGVSQFLKLEGMVPWEQNFERIAQAFCGCVFYKNNANNKVGIPNRLFEYMYCGIPVLVSDFPELRKIVEKTGCGLVVNSESPKDIARGINDLLANPEMAHNMGKNGRLALEQEYGYHIDLQKLINFYYVVLRAD